MKGFGKMGIFLVATVVTWLVLAMFVAPMLGMNLASVTAQGLMGWVAAALISVGVVQLLKSAKVANLSPYKTKWYMAVVIVLVGLFLGGVVALPGNFSLTGASVLSPSANVQGNQPVSSSGCIVNADLKGKAATLNINAYDVEAASPYGTAVDINPTYITRKAVDGTTTITSISDTSAASVTGYTVGDTVSLVGGTAAYYMDAYPETCITGEQMTIELHVHNIQGEANMTTTVYDDTGATALSAGVEGIDYTASMVQNTKKFFFVKESNNAAYDAYWLAAYGFAVGTNITSASPVDSLFQSEAIATPTHLENVAIALNSTAQQSMTRSYKVYKLVTPVMLHASESLKFKIEVVSSSAADPVGKADATTSSFVAGISKDQQWVRGVDGVLYLDIQDHTTSQADVGLRETATSPIGKETGFMLEIT